MGGAGPSSADNESDVKVVKLEDADVEGVARVDANGAWQSNARRVQLLVVGDAVAILLFSAAGRVNHGEVLDLELLLTALPFWAGWFATGSVLGAFDKDAQDGYVAPAAIAAARAWAVATPLSLTLRAVIKGYVPPTPFILVSFTVTGALLIGWRSALAAATTPWDKLSAVEKFRRSKSKQGNAAEFMQLLGSLTKRW